MPEIDGQAVICIRTFGAPPTSRHTTPRARSPRVRRRVANLPPSTIRQQWGGTGGYPGISTDISTDEKVKRPVVVSGVEQATGDRQS
jgi:hypothetical protein